MNILRVKVMGGERQVVVGIHLYGKGGFLTKKKKNKTKFFKKF